MRPSLLLLFALVLAAPAEAAPASLGVSGLWGAFRDGVRCYAIAQAGGRDEGGRASASVSWWPGRGVRGQLHFRLDRPKRTGSAILLRIDDRTFQLIGGGANAWAPDSRADADIVTAMRTGIDMVLETRSDSGGVIRDVYRLRGAATAIDAAAIGCAR